MVSRKSRSTSKTETPEFMRYLVVFVALFAVTSCATYYQSNLSFNQEFENGDLEAALTTLRSKSSENNWKKAFLYDVNNGTILSMLGRYDESNEYFEKAYLYGEDYRKNYLYEATSYLTNPTFTPYRGEDHEHLMVLYYKALNYVKAGMYDEALVECRRLNIRLQQLSDRYDSEDKYREDAFINLLMGIIYDADKDYNNAFIAYRNAYNVYTGSFSRLFNVTAPEQLKEDLLRTAWLSGMGPELEQYKTEFNREDYQYKKSENPELVFFWQNGLSPIKAEWGINFVITRRNNMIYFNNESMNLSFPFNLDQYSESDRKGLANLEVFRVAFPKYVERPVYFQEATLRLGSRDIPLQKATDINAIAFKCLSERMALEMSKALVRVALKKVTEYEIRKSDKGLGAMVGVINGLTEKADTRNWQTLPHEIFYARVPLETGRNSVTLTIDVPGTSNESKQKFEYDAKPGQLLFHTFTSLESRFPTYY